MIDVMKKRLGKHGSWLASLEPLTKIDILGVQLLVKSLLDLETQAAYKLLNKVLN